MQDSFRIALHLEAHHGGPSLFGGEIGQALGRFFNSWVDRTLVPRLVPLVALDVQDILDAADGRHLRGVMEKAFGKTLEELAANRDKDVVGFRRLLDPARASLRSQPFISGAQPAYRRLHPVQPVPVGAHRERLRAARSRRRACRLARADARPARRASRARSRARHA